MFIRTILIVLGCAAVALGVIGIFVPGLPTTPFLLLASWAFYKGSPRLQHRLLDSRLGIYIKSYEEKRGLALRNKLAAIGMMALMCGVSIVFFIPGTAARIVVAVAGLIGTIVVGFVVPTVK